MAQTYNEGGSPYNYTIGGTRLWFDRLLDDSTTPKRYQGYVDFGNIITAPLEATKEMLDHFSSRSGKRVKDKTAVKQLSEAITVTLDECCKENLRLFFMGGDYTDVPASTGTESVSAEIARMDGTELRILGKGYNASNIVVLPIASSVALVLNTDYTVEDVIGGYKGIRRVDTSVSLLDGDYVSISYDYDVRAHAAFYPITNTEIFGKALFFGVSDSGQEFTREMENTQIEPAGAFDFKDQDWTTFQYKISLLDDTTNNPTFPFGIFRHYGRGTGL